MPPSEDSTDRMRAFDKQQLSKRAARRFAFLIEYEPSWFAEFMSAVGIFAWASAAYLTDNYVIHPWAWAMPVFGAFFGPLRAFLLLHLDALPRVLAACGGFVWWAYVIWTLQEKIGIVPAHGAFFALMLGDCLTVCRFSLAALRERRHRNTPTFTGAGDA